MKNLFKSFHIPSDEAIKDAWGSNNTIFAFDTNVLLNLYSYAEQTRNDFFNVLRSLGNKIWLPYHVGLEYQLNRMEVIRNEKAVFNDLIKAIEKIDKIFTTDISRLALKKRFPKLDENTEKLQKEINKLVINYKKSVDHWDKKQPCVRSHDIVRETINTLFENRVGCPPNNQETLDKIFKEGEQRYKDKVPPGFEDMKKSNEPNSNVAYNNLRYDRQYGDLIIWKQLIEEAKREEVKNVILVTDDSKEDWWYVVDSRGKKQIGPHANLQSEIYREAKIDLFHMYNTSNFLEDGKVNLEIRVHDSSIEDAHSLFWINSNLKNGLLENKNLYKSWLKEARDLQDKLNVKETLSKMQDDSLKKSILTHLPSINVDLDNVFSENKEILNEDRENLLKLINEMEKNRESIDKDKESLLYRLYLANYLKWNNKDKK